MYYSQIDPHNQTYYSQTDPHNPQESSSNANGATTRKRKRILQFVQEMNHQLSHMQKCYPWCIKRQTKGRTVQNLAVIFATSNITLPVTRNMSSV